MFSTSMLLFPRAKAARMTATSAQQVRYGNCCYCWIMVMVGGGAVVIFVLNFFVIGVAIFMLLVFVVK